MKISNNFLFVILLSLCTVNTNAQRTPKDFSYFTDIDSISKHCPIVIVNQNDIITKENELSSASNITPTERQDIQPQIPNSYNITKNGIVGDIPYTFEITASGTTNINVPIECPQPTSGFAPQISLSYNSIFDIGPVGYGWNISGVSTIAKCNSTYYFDGKTEGSDPPSLMLDGERIVTQKVEGLYMYFQTHKSNIKVKYDYVVDTVEVLYPNGFRSYYRRAVGNHNIYKQIDNAGNKIEYTYEHLYENGTRRSQTRIKTIKYSNNITINFEYDYNSALFETVGVYSYGSKIVYDYRLSKISIDQGGTNMWSYVFRYNKNGTYLTVIGKNFPSDGIGTTLNSLFFVYGLYNDSVNEYTEKNSQLSMFLNFQKPGDITLATGKFDYGSDNDGLIMYANKKQYYESTTRGYTNNYDGTEDIVFAPLTDRWNPSCIIKTDPNFVDLICADIDSVKGDEIIKIRNGTYMDKTGKFKDEISIHVYSKIQGAGFREKYVRSYTFGDALSYILNNSIIPKYYFTGDFNGDGKCELMLVSVASPVLSKGLKSRVMIFDLEDNKILYNGSPFDYQVSFPSSTQSGGDAYANSDRLFTIDSNSDGKTELCLVNNLGTRIYEFSENYECKGSYTLDLKKELLKTRELLIGEFNGDGKTDLLLSPETDNLTGFGSEIWSIYLQTGYKYFDRFPTYITKKSPNYQYFCQDIDLDGQTDLVKIYNYRPPSSSNIPPDYTIHVDFIRNATKNGKMTPYERADTIVVFPINHMSKDYNAGLLILNNKGKATKLSYNFRADKSRLLTGISDSFGRVTKFDYEPLTPNPFYIFPNEVAHFPYYNFVGGFWAGTRVQQYNNNVLHSDLEYKYTNGVMHKQGLGFCGFSKIEQKDKISGKKYIQNFDPYRFGVKTSDSSDQEENTYTYDIKIEPNKSMQILLTKKHTINKINGNNTTSSFSYDSYGNLTGSQIFYGGNLEKQQQIEYFNNVNNNNHVIGLPTMVKDICKRNGESYNTVTSTSYNNYNLPVAKKTYVNNNNLITEELFEYDNFKNLIKQSYRNYKSDWLSRKYGYRDKELISKTNENNQTETYTYKALGLVETITDNKGNKTTYKYNSIFQRTETVYPDSLIEKSIATWAKDVPEALIKIETTATGKPTKVAYLNALKQEIRTGEQRFDGKYLYVDKQYDIKGRLVKVSQPFKTSASQWNSFTYDNFDRTLTTTYASGRSESNSYSGRNVTSTVAGISTTRKYDAIGTLTSVIDPGGEITYEYRPDNQLRSITAPGGVVTSFNYDEYGRQTAINDPSAGLKQFAYDNAGNVNCETDARGKTVKFTHDRFNRVIKREYDGGLTIDYVYNEDGKLLSATDSKRKRNSFKYDHLSRVIEEKDSIYQLRWYKKNYHYGKGSVITDIDHTDKLAYIATENYKYSNGHPTEITLNDTIPVWKLSEENAKGLSTKLRTGPLYRSYFYDDEGRTNSRFVYLPDADIQLLTYKYNSITGNMDWRDDGMHITKKESFGYDNLNRLTSFGANTVQYATNGNITSMSNVGSFTYEGAKPYAIATATPTHDLIPIRDQHIVYNAMLQPDTIREGKLVGSFNYFGDGRRSEMRIQRSGYSLQRYYMGDCYETDNLVVIRTVTEQRKLYVGGDYYSAPAVLVKTNKGAWKLHYIMRDNLGSITHVTDATGNLVQELSYDPWGNIRDPKTHIAYATDSVPVPFLGRGFTGHEHLQQFGLINMNGRLYDPALGRFLSPDPYVQMPDFTQNFNRFSYCLNNPLIYNDPSGEFIFSAFLPGVGVFIDAICWSATMGAMKNGISSMSNGGTFWNGAWKGAISGAVGGLISPIGGVLFHLA